MKIIDLTRITPKRFSIEFVNGRLKRSAEYNETRLKELKIFTLADKRRIEKMEMGVILNLQSEDETGKTRIYVTRIK